MSEDGWALLRDWANAYIGPDSWFPDGGYAAGIQTLAKAVLELRAAVPTPPDQEDDN